MCARFAIRFITIAQEYAAFRGEVQAQALDGEGLGALVVLYLVDSGIVVRLREGICTVRLIVHARLSWDYTSFAA